MEGEEQGNSGESEAKHKVQEPPFTPPNPHLLSSDHSQVQKNPLFMGFPMAQGGERDRTEG